VDEKNVKAFFASIRAEGGSGPAEPPRDPPKPDDPPKPGEKLSMAAADLAAAFVRDEAAARAKYKDQTITLTGVAEGLAQDIRLGVGVNLQTQQPGPFVSCLGVGEAPTVLNLSRKGQGLKITGVCLGKLGKNVVLHPCSEAIITRTEDPPKPGDPPQGNKG